MSHEYSMQLFPIQNGLPTKPHSTVVTLAFATAIGSTSIIMYDAPNSILMIALRNDTHIISLP